MVQVDKNVKISNFEKMIRFEQSPHGKSINYWLDHQKNVLFKNWKTCPKLKKKNILGKKNWRPPTKLSDFELDLICILNNSKYSALS